MKNITVARHESLELASGKILQAEFGVRKSVFSLEVESYYFDLSNEVLSEEEERWSFTPLTLEKKSSRAIPFLNYFNDKMKYGQLTPLDWSDLRDCINNALSQPKLWDYCWSTVSQLKKISGAVALLSTNGSGSEIFQICDQEILAKALITLSDAFAFDDVNALKREFNWDSRWLKSRKSHLYQLRITANKKINENEEIFNVICSEVVTRISEGKFELVQYIEEQGVSTFKVMTSFGEVYGRMSDNEAGIFMSSTIKKDGVCRYDSKNVGWTYLKVRQ